MYLCFKAISVSPSSDEQHDVKFFREDYTYIESEESFYKIHTTQQYFADAEQACALEEASLFYAENIDEVNAVVSFWNRTQPLISRIFVGLSERMAEGLFETVDRTYIGCNRLFYQIAVSNNTF